MPIFPAYMSMPSPWLSVLIPFYGVEAYLRDCVQSVLSQSGDGVEIILVDDGSRDGSTQIASELQRRHPDRITLLSHDVNRGISQARNTALAHASGEYVWFIDSDDLMLPGAIPDLHRIVSEQDVDLVMCDFRVVRERTALKHVLRGERHRSTFSGASGRVLSDRDALVQGLMEKRQLHPWSKIARRRVWAAAPFPVGRVVTEDAAALPALIAGVRTCIHVPRTWIGYRQREGSALARFDARKYRDVMSTVSEISQQFDRMGLQQPASHCAVDYFCLRMLASIGGKLDRGDAELRTQWLATLAAVFPEGVSGVLESISRRGWWWQVRRIRGDLRKLEVVV